jgi:hypothetical protein
MSPRNSSLTSATFRAAETQASSASPPNVAVAPVKRHLRHIQCPVAANIAPYRNHHVGKSTCSGHGKTEPYIAVRRIDKAGGNIELAESTLLVVAPRFVNCAGDEQKGTSPSEIAPWHSSFAGTCAKICRANSENMIKKCNFILKTALLRRKNRRLSCIIFQFGQQISA